MEILQYVEPLRPGAEQRLPRKGEDATTVLVCPGCELWQIDYTADVRKLWTPSLFRLAVEQVLASHLAECAYLQVYVEA